MSTATRPRTTRQVAHVMGMPISLALRGRHATTAAGERAWLEAVDAPSVAEALTRDVSFD